MRKEILIATIAGIMIGLLVAFGSWRANLALKVKGPESNTNQTSNNSKGKDSSKNSQKDGPKITLTNVDDYDVLTESGLKLTGITKPGYLVAISAEDEDFVIKADNDGSFEQDVQLVAGVNQILLSAFTTDGIQLEKKLTVVYSMEFDKVISDAN